MIAQSIGRFKLIRKLPAGGMGRVFEADDPSGGHRVALKLIDLAPDPDSVQIVAAERLGAELQKRLCAIDDRITRIYEWGEMPDYFYIVMEYVEGRDLSELAPAIGADPFVAARVIQEVLEGLHKAHRFSTRIDGREYRGIVHGDIKPRNIRLMSSGKVKILDFGIAKALSMTRSFTFNAFGSLQYSSPERLKTGEVDVGSDLWGVAVVLFEMLNGKPYFQAEPQSRLDHMIRNYQQVQPLPAACPEALRPILKRALDPDPSARYRTAAEFAAALDAFRKGQLSATTTADERTRRVSQPVGAQGRPAQPNTSHAGTPDSEATRRAAPPPRTAPGTPVAQPRATNPSIKRKWTPFRKFLVAVGGLIFAFLCVLTYFAVTEYLAWQSSHQLASEVDSERTQNLDVAWQQYQKIAPRAHLPITLWAAQNALRSRFLADGSRTVSQYRDSDAPPVTENDWSRARVELARALELSPHDKTVRGTLRVVDGHLARIRGTSRRDPRLLEESREDFEDATKLMKSSPDPWLGLARLYISSLHDLDRGQSALKEAERRGHDIGKRETAQLADGYRYRAEGEIALAAAEKSPGDAQRQYDRAARDLDRARELYQSIEPWAGTAAGLRKVEQSASRIDQRRSQLGER